MLNKDLKIDAVLLAAGASIRFGESNKLLAEINKKPMILYIAEKILLSGVKSLTIITGHDHKIISEMFYNKKIKVFHNSKYLNGHASTLSIAIKSLPEDSKAVMICLSDMPYLTTENYRSLLRRHIKKSSQNTISAPFFDGKRGNPVIWSNSYYKKLSQLKGDTGGKSIIDEFERNILYHKTASKNYFLDIDTKKDYEKLLKDHSHFNQKNISL